MNIVFTNKLAWTIALLLAATFLMLALTQPAIAQSSLADQAQSGVDAAGGAQNSTSLTSTVSTVIETLLFIIGIISVIMIIIGGIRYTTSGGDATATKGARDTILYAIIGLVVAFVAWGIVTFVINVL